jgi:CDP-diacylglycerol--glycerol-3-phosphate 3-phosphatidyltransferase
MLPWSKIRLYLRNLSIEYFESPIASGFHYVGLTPNKVTLLGLLISLIASYLIFLNEFMLSGILLLIAGWLDMMDGSIARKYGQSSIQGAFLDSVADRISEAATLIGLFLFYLYQPLDHSYELILVFIVLFFSMMVSYLRSRGEGFGIDCKVGIMTRPERVFVLSIGLILNQVQISLIIITILSILTVLQRMIYILRRL